MFHAMRFAGFAEDESVPLPALNLWFRAEAPFRSSSSTALGGRTPYAVYGNGVRTVLPARAGSEGKYYFYTSLEGMIDVVADDAFQAVSLADSDDVNDMASSLAAVMAIGPFVSALSDRAFLGCKRLGPVFEPLYYGDALTLGDSCFEGCSGIREFSARFLGKVAGSGESAFARCTSLRTIDGMSAFDPCADRSFYGCTSLESLHGGFSEATNLGESCFEGCSSLVTLGGLPETLLSLSGYCFASCKSLTDITALASTNVSELPEGCFYKCVSLESVDCGGGSVITRFGDSCFEKCEALSSLDGVPSGLLSAGDRCFARCSSLSDITALAGTHLVALGDSCFEECEHLQTLDALPLSLLSIGERCFRDSYGEGRPAGRASEEWGLHDISRLGDILGGWEENVAIPARCFEGDRLIRSLPDLSAVTRKLTIGPYAFSGCSGLDTLAGMPTGVEIELGEGAFSWCYRAPHDWWETIGGTNAVGKTTRWCGMYQADMSGWHQSVTKLPARCFQGCGALPELPPLPPKLMEMGDYCFADCTGMKNLDSLADLDVEVTTASTHFNDGNPVAPEYPRFGAWCFARCGLAEAGGGWKFFNRPSTPPETGELTDITGLVDLCDNIETAGVSKMSASSAGVIHELIQFFRSTTLAAMDPVVQDDVYRQFCTRDGGMWILLSSGGVGSFMFSFELDTLAGVVKTASERAARGGFTAFFGEATEVKDLDHPAAVDGTKHTVVALAFPTDDPLSSARDVWVCCPGVDSELLVTAGPTSTVTVGGPATYDRVTVEFRFDLAASVNVGVRVFRGGDVVVDGPSTMGGVHVLRLSSDRSWGPAGTKEAQVLNFMAFMAYATAGLSARANGNLYSANFGPMHVSSVTTYVVSRLTAALADAALLTLHDLNLVTPALSMLSDHCFDGCVNLAPTVYPFLVEDVPPFCFANTAVDAMAPFGHVRSIGAGAFMNTPVETLDGFPSRVGFVSYQAFCGCKALEDASGVPRTASEFGPQAFAFDPLLTDLTCSAAGEWPSSTVTRLREELFRAAGARSQSGLDYGGPVPPLAAFAEARAVETFGVSCFEGDVSLTDASLTVEFTAGPLEDALQRVRTALSSAAIYMSSAPTLQDMDFTAVFHLAADLDFVVSFSDDTSGYGPAALDRQGEAIGEGIYAAKLRSVSYDVSGDAQFYSYSVGGGSRTLCRDLASFDDYKHAPSESWDPEIVIPARKWPGETGLVVASIDSSGYLRLILETEGQRFEALVSIFVQRWTDQTGTVSQTNLEVSGYRVSPLGRSAPGYPSTGGTKRYSAVPCLTTIGASCFEGCVGLSSLSWLPLAVTVLPSRCFAGVPFKHPIQYDVPRPEYSGWESPTVSAYQSAISDLLGWSKFYADDDGGTRPAAIAIRRESSDEDYIRFAVSYAVVDGNLVPSLAGDPDHAATAAVDGNVDVPASGYGLSAEAPLGRTYGLAGRLEVVSVQGNAATLRVGDLTFLFTVTNTLTGTTDASLQFECSYVSCPPYDAMVSVLSTLNGSSVSYADEVFSVEVDGEGALDLAFDAETGTWVPTYGQFHAPVSSEPGADRYTFLCWLSGDELEDDRLHQEAHDRFWFQAAVPDLTGDSDDKPYRTMYAYATVATRTVPTAECSVEVPPWVTIIGRDCFTFKGFDDAEDKLKALYIRKSPREVREMTNYPWGVPSGCCIYSSSGLVYRAP